MSPRNASIRIPAAPMSRGQMVFRGSQSYVPTRFLTWDDANRRLIMEGRIVDRTNSVIIETTRVENTVAEQVIYRGEISADDMRAGNFLKILASGLVSNSSASDDFALRIYMGDILLNEIHPAIGNVTDADWHMSLYLTVRSLGVEGQIAFHTNLVISGSDDAIVNEIKTINTEQAQDITITVQWDNAEPENIIKCLQGVLEYKH